MQSEMIHTSTTPIQSSPWDQAIDMLISAHSETVKLQMLAENQGDAASIAAADNAKKTSQDLRALFVSMLPVAASSAGSPTLDSRVQRLLGAPMSPSQSKEETGILEMELPLGRITVEAGDPGTLRETSEGMLRVERLILASDHLNQFDVTSIYLGTEPSLAAIANLPAEAFLFDAPCRSLRGNTLHPGMSVSVGVLNIGVNEYSIAGVVRGESKIKMCTCGGL